MRPSYSRVDLSAHCSLRMSIADMVQRCLIFRLVALTGLFLLVAGCVSGRDDLVTVEGVNGSDDHRIFRIGPATRVMMEPVFWKLEDTGKIDFDRSVADYFRDPLPPEFDRVTLRMLHDNRTGLPDGFLDGWCLGDLYELAARDFVGTHAFRAVDSRQAFVRLLWSPRIRSCLRHDGPRESAMGYALLMMAVTDTTGKSLDELCQEHLVRPYGLKDTSFALRPGMECRLTKSCAGRLPWLVPSGLKVPDHRGGDVSRNAGGLLSSVSDMLRVAYVILPNLERSKGFLSTKRLDCGRTIYYLSGSTYGGRAFIGFDPRAMHAAVRLENTSGCSDESGMELLESLIAPGTGL